MTSDDSQNVTATVSSNVTLTCAIQTADPVRWKRFIENSTLFITIFNGKRQNPRFSRFTVKTDEVTGRSELMINNVTRHDSGTYFCDLTYGSPISNFTLTVLVLGKYIYDCFASKLRSGLFHAFIVEFISSLECKSPLSIGRGVLLHVRLKIRQSQPNIYTVL